LLYVFSNEGSFRHTPGLNTAAFFTMSGFSQHPVFRKHTDSPPFENLTKADFIFRYFTNCILK